jgi:hypothetical protein
MGAVADKERAAERLTAKLKPRRRVRQTSWVRQSQPSLAGLQI